MTWACAFAALDNNATELPEGWEPLASVQPSVLYSEDQPRDDKGEWTSGGGGSSEGDSKGGSMASRVERARAAHNPCMADKQHAGEANEEVLVNGLGGGTYQSGDNAPVDVLTEINGEVHGIEVKTMVDQVNNKITMSKDAIARKRDWMKENEPAALHTVIFDTRGGQTSIYYRRGVGSFRMSSMTPVTSWARLRRLMREP